MVPPATLLMVNMGLIGLLATALLIAAVSDIRYFIISNRLCLAITLAAPLFIIAQLGVPGKEYLGGSIKLHLFATLAIAVTVFAICSIFFAFGVMGGGDVKIMSAIALWTGPQWTLAFLFLTALAGGFVTLAVLLRARLGPKFSLKTSPFVKNPELTMAEMPELPMAKQQVPYGVGIAIGGLITAYNMGFQTYMSF